MHFLPRDALGTSTETQSTIGGTGPGSARRTGRSSRRTATNTPPPSSLPVAIEIRGYCLRARVEISLIECDGVFAFWRDKLARAELVSWATDELPFPPILSNCSSIQHCRPYYSCNKDFSPLYA
ncbi:unnamed protein product [Danaus chrysippus]|uniref:(African queen) hypothetical protein n=1 Tax=Danaus chrysippus TaxID=151541 RepID=A0A8J2W6X0_9NEOP|nr:unnamed protein product [Danaus chrysippus]